MSASRVTTAPQPHHTHVRARTVLGALAVTVVAAAIELAGASSGESLFLAADSLHLLAHVAILGVLLVPAARWHDRSEDVAVVSVLSVVLVVSGGITLASLHQLVVAPQAPPEPSLLLLSLLGLVANLATAYLFRRASQTRWSFRAALAHQLSDAAHRVAGLVGAVAIELFAWRWIDPGLSLLIGVWLGVWAGRLLARRVRFGHRAWAFEEPHG
jgi:cobalt-zinc-cadmium efflux system protein